MDKTWSVTSDVFQNVGFRKLVRNLPQTACFSCLGVVRDTHGFGSSKPLAASRPCVCNLPGCFCVRRAALRNCPACCFSWNSQSVGAAAFASTVVSLRSLPGCAVLSSLVAAASAPRHPSFVCNKPRPSAAVFSRPRRTGMRARVLRCASHARNTCYALYATRATPCTQNLRVRNTGHVRTSSTCHATFAAPATSGPPRVWVCDCTPATYAALASSAASPAYAPPNTLPGMLFQRPQIVYPHLPFTVVLF